MPIICAGKGQSVNTAGGNTETHGTRDRIVRLLLKKPHTVEELAAQLDVTENAVRAQIALLQRDRTVEVQGSVKSGRRPAAVYGVPAGADVHISKAYPAVLAHLVKVLADRMPQREFKAVMKDLGKDIAASAPRLSGDARQRVGGAVRYLRSQGSLVEMAEEKGKIVITSSGCPIGQVVANDARACLAMEALIAQMTGLPVAEHCDRSGHPHCRFEITVPPGA